MHLDVFDERSLHVFSLGNVDIAGVWSRFSLLPVQQDRCLADVTAVGRCGYCRRGFDQRLLTFGIKKRDVCC